MSVGKRIGFVVLGVLIVGGLASVLFLHSSLDAIVRRALEHYGSEVAGTDVTVASVSLEIREGKGTVGGLDVANPDGFSGDDAFRLGSLRVDLDLKSLTGDPIVIDEIRVDGLRIVVEPLPEGRVNLDVLRRNAAAYGASGHGGEESPSRRLRIRSLVFGEGELVLDLEPLGKETRTAKLPGFRLTDLGGARGAEPGEIGKQVVEALARQGLSAAARQGLTDELQERLGEEAGEAAGGIIDKILH